MFEGPVALSASIGVAPVWFLSGMSVTVRSGLVDAVCARGVFAFGEFIYNPNV